VSTANRGHAAAACQALRCALAGAAAAAAERPAPARELRYPRNIYKSLAETAQDTRLLRKDCCPGSLAPSCSRTQQVRYISVHTQDSAQHLMALPQHTSSLYYTKASCLAHRRSILHRLEAQLRQRQALCSNAPAPQSAREDSQAQRAQSLPAASKHGPMRCRRCSSSAGCALRPEPKAALPASYSCCRRTGAAPLAHMAREACRAARARAGWQRLTPWKSSAHARLPDKHSGLGASHACVMQGLVQPRHALCQQDSRSSSRC